MSLNNGTVRKTSTHTYQSKKKPINLDSILTPVYKSFVSELFFVIISHNRDFFFFKSQLKNILKIHS